MSGRAAALFDSDSDDGSDDDKLNTAARARNISQQDTRKTTTTRTATSSSTSSPSSSSSSDSIRLFTNITPDPRDDIEDESLRARLLSLVQELRQGKPPRVIDMVLRGIVHDPLRARVYEVAGVRDPQAPAEEVAAEEDQDEHQDEDEHVPVRTAVNRTTPARTKSAAVVEDEDEDEDEDVEVKHVNQQHIHQEEEEDEEPTPLRQPSPTFTRSSRASSTHSEKPKKSKRSRRHPRSSSPSPSITSTTSYDDRITLVSDEQRVTSLDVIESDAHQYDEPHALLILVFILGAASSADLLIIFPSLYAYLDHLGRFSFLIYGFVASGYNAGQILAAPLLGWWTDKRTIKEVLLFCTACLCAGNLMYIFANSNVILLIMGRFVAGLGAANVFIAYAHIAKCSKSKDQRQMRHTRYGWLLRLTAIVAPGIGSLGSRISGDHEITHDATLNSYTFPAMIMTIIFGCLLIMQLIHAIWTRNQGEKNFSQRFDDADLEAGRLRLGGDSFLTRDGIVLLLVYGMILLAYWAFITASFPFVQSEYEWSLQHCYIYYLEVGIIFTVSFATLQVALHYSTLSSTSTITHTSLIHIALLLVTLGSLMLTQFESLQIREWQIYVTAVLMGCGYTIGIELIPRMFAALTGVEFASLGLRMSYFFAVASLSASFGPLLGALAIHFTDLPTLGLITLGGCLAITVLVIAVPPSKMDGHSRSQLKTRNSNRTGLHESLLASPARVYS